ncbi:Scarecrow-like protein 15 [Apostasia shenzhenica]|uniref:Scarecrow-like protein 15 n=1 Tax=Apostasia shenzhenica TaxID=1088818 RepID=A0A2I0ADP3_9ASPA|nr:Scarecrow-like protein 15 [Apostasia shenzhenica]
MKIQKTTAGDSAAAISQLPKPLVSPSFLYEPTSVLDPHLTSSPSAAVSVAASATGGELPVVGGLSCCPSSFAIPAGDDWPEPISWLLSENPCSDIEYTASFFSDLSQFPSLPPAPVAPEDQADLLLRAASSVECGDLNSSHAILARLNLLLPFPSGGPFNRAVFHFKDALLCFLSNADRPACEPPLSASELVRRIASHKAFCDLSPIPQFTSFTANQTLLEALAGTCGNSLHLIDFDFGLGYQWSSFVQELAARSRATRVTPPSIRVTAVVAGETIETALAGENLRDFGRGIGVRITVEFAKVGGLNQIRLAVGETVGVVLSPAIFRLVGISVLKWVRRAAPRVVAFVDTECVDGGGCSFRRKFAGVLEQYVAIMESLEAGAAEGAGEEAVRRIERAVLRPRIFAAVAAAASAGEWRDMMAAGGMAAAELSEFTEVQADLLLRRSPTEGFHVARREGSMVLSWRGRELAATSAWRCF